MRRAAWLACLGLCAWSCARAPAPLAGGVYSVRDAGRYRVVKVLALDAEGVHLRLYRNQWQSRPGQIVPAELSLGAIGDAGGSGIGHLAVTGSEFAALKPKLLLREPLRPDELASYETWKRGRSGDFLGRP